MPTPSGGHRVAASRISKETRSRIMASISSRGNRSTELAVVKLLRAAGIAGWRRHKLITAGACRVRPDFVFPFARLAIFIDGCFWHGCPRHGKQPSTNKQYWRRKLFHNMARDVMTTRALRQAGWRVLRLWEHDVQESPARCTTIVKQRLRSHAKCRHR